jgi:hypothetical protein
MPATDLCSIYGDDSARIEALSGTSKSTLEQFGAILGEFLHRDVTVEPTNLPHAVACIWLGYENAEYLGYNQDWPVPAIELIAHATGHLSLGHCGSVRDCGQFACALAPRIDPTAREEIRAFLHDPEAILERGFTELQEHEADYFATVHIERLSRPTAAGHLGEGKDLAFVCVG